MKKQLRQRLRLHLWRLQPFGLYSSSMIANKLFPRNHSKKESIEKELARRAKAFADPRGMALFPDNDQYWGFQWQASTVHTPKGIPSATVPITKARLLGHYPMLAEKLSALPDFSIPPHLLPPFFVGITVWAFGAPELAYGRRRQTRKRLAGQWIATDLPAKELHPGLSSK